MSSCVPFTYHKVILLVVDRNLANSSRILSLEIKHETMPYTQCYQQKLIMGDTTSSMNITDMSNDIALSRIGYRVSDYCRNTCRNVEAVLKNISISLSFVPTSITCFENFLIFSVFISVIQ